MFGRLTFRELLTEERELLREAWTDVARAASAASRRLRAKGRGKAIKRGRKPLDNHLSPDDPEYKQEVAQAAKTTGAIRAHLADRQKRAADSAKAAQQYSDARRKQQAADEKQAQAAATKKKGNASAAKKAVAAPFDARAKALASELYTMAQAKQTDTPEYAHKYAAYRKVLEDKRVALGGAHTVKAPTKSKSASGRAPHTLSVRPGQTAYRRTPKTKTRTITRVVRSKKS